MGCVVCRFDGSDLFRTVLILDNNRLPTPLPFSSRRSPAITSALDVMSIDRAM